MDDSEEYQEIRQACLYDAQERYESIRPIVLGQEPSTRARARQTSYDRRTIQARVNRFLEQGMRGLIDDYSDGHDSIPKAAQRHIVGLLHVYPKLGYTELARICFKEFKVTIPWRKIRDFVQEVGRPHFQRPLQFHQYDNRFEARRQVVRLYLNGWRPTSIAGVLGMSQSHVYNIIDRFEQEHIAGLHPKSRAPNRAARKVTFPLITLIYHLQKEYPDAGRYNIWALLPREAEKHGIDLPEISERTVGRYMAENRKVYDELAPTKKASCTSTTAHLPYRPTHLHSHWYIDIRHLPTATDETVYSICVLEGHSRAILAGAVSLTKDTEAILQVLYSASLSFGRPEIIVSDNEQQFRSHRWQQVVVEDLEIEHRRIESGKSYQNLIEPWFTIQHRLADAKFKGAEKFEYTQRIHSEFLWTYNHRPHKGLRDEGRQETIPINALGMLRPRPVSRRTLNRVFGRVLYERTINRYGCIRLRCWSIFIEDGLPKRRIHVWLTAEKLVAEYRGTKLAEYRCEFDKTNKKLKVKGAPILYDTPYRSTQLRLFRRDQLEWTPAREVSTRNNSSRPGSPYRQLVLFEVAV